MFARITIRASDFAVSAQFYRSSLHALGIKPTHMRDELLAWDDFAILPSDSEHPATRDLHIAFVALTPSKCAPSGRPASAPADRATASRDDVPITHRPITAPFKDPDGNSVDAVAHHDTRRGRNVDHLWIGVRDLRAASTFYTALARHTGLRVGTNWDTGHQFPGAWATFSLIADGRAPTKNVHSAFPAPDRQDVEELEAALAAEVSARTAGKWAARYRADGTAAAVRSFLSAVAGREPQQREHDRGDRRAQAVAVHGP